MLIYAIEQMIIIDLVTLCCIPWHLAAFQGTRLHYKTLGCIPRHSTAFQGTRLHSEGLNFDSNRLSMDGPYESTNRQGRLRARIAKYTKTPSETKVADNSFCIVFSVLISKTTTFMYEIKHIDPLNEILLLSITTNTIFPYIT
jgi:hypothetical protein